MACGRLCVGILDAIPLLGQNAQAPANMPRLDGRYGSAVGRRDVLCNVFALTITHSGPEYLHHLRPTESFAKIKYRDRWCPSVRRTARSPRRSLRTYLGRSGLFIPCVLSTLGHLRSSTTLSPVKFSQNSVINRDNNNLPVGTAATDSAMMLSTSKATTFFMV